VPRHLNEDRAPEGSSNSRHTTGSRKSYKTESPLTLRTLAVQLGFKDKAVIGRYCGELRARLLLAPSQGNGESKIPERMPAPRDKVSAAVPHLRWTAATEIGTASLDELALAEARSFQLADTDSLPTHCFD